MIRVEGNERTHVFIVFSHDLERVEGEERTHDDETKDQDGNREARYSPQEALHVVARTHR